MSVLKYYLLLIRECSISSGIHNNVLPTRACFLVQFADLHQAFTSSTKNRWNIFKHLDFSPWFDFWSASKTSTDRRTCRRTSLNANCESTCLFGTHRMTTPARGNSTLNIQESLHLGSFDADEIVYFTVWQLSNDVWQLLISILDWSQLSSCR